MCVHQREGDRSMLEILLSRIRGEILCVCSIAHQCYINISVEMLMNAIWRGIRRTSVEKSPVDDGDVLVKNDVVHKSHPVHDNTWAEKLNVA